MNNTHRDTTLSVSPIEEADIERGPSGETDALLSKGSMDGADSHDASMESSRHLDGDDSDKARQRLVTTILINLSAIMERTDEQLLPAVYRFVGASFQVVQISNERQKLQWHVPTTQHYCLTSSLLTLLHILGYSVIHDVSMV